MIQNIDILESKALDNGDYRVKFTFDGHVGDNKMTGKEVETLVRNTGGGWHAEIPK